MFSQTLSPSSLPSRSHCRSRDPFVPEVPR